MFIYIFYRQLLINLKYMKTKKLSIIISSILSESILQMRNWSFEQMNKKISTFQQKINQMHRNNQYSKELYYDLVERSQYNIEQKINSKQNRILQKVSILIHFKLTQKMSSSICIMQSWLVSTQKINRNEKASKVDTDQQMVYLLEQVLRGLKCQFLTDFMSMGQQLRSRYILDYEIEVTPPKRSLKKLSGLGYEHMWKKQSILDDQNKLSVTCFHNSDRKLRSLISQSRMESRCKTAKANLKHGSQETKPSNSGEYELSTSIQEKGYGGRQRKTSMIEFYDEDLNITVLSSDSDSFKRSTGRIQGVYVNQEEEDDDFQLLIEESLDEESKKQNPLEKQYQKIKEIEKDFSNILRNFDQATEDFSI